MSSARVVCWFAILGSITLAAQSNTPTLINRPAPNKVSGDLSKPDPKTQGKILESYGKLPLSFEANQGQTDSRVKFLSRGSGYTLFLTGDEAVFSLRGSKGDGEALPTGLQLRPKVAPTGNAVLRMKLVKANSAAKVTGVDKLPGKSNYFIGNDPKKWRANVTNYAKVKYESVYSGIDLVYYGNQRQLEYDFLVAPGADPHRIQFEVHGAKRISRDESGDLVLQVGEGEVRWQKPVVYQEQDGTRQEIAARYVIKHNHRVGFEVADYDSGRPLFIDPLVYSTYLGGGDDAGFGIAVDTAGSVYVTGYTFSPKFPVTLGAFQRFRAGREDAFVTKFNPTGSALVYSTYLGGRGDDVGYSIAADSLGNAYLTGSTTSTDFPTKNPLQPANGGGPYDAFVAEINPSGSALVYSTYLGGSLDDVGQSIAVDSSGNAYVTGRTISTDFPTMNPLQPVNGGSYDAFVSEINPSGSALVYSTYLGGGGADYGYSIAMDSSRNVYVIGYTGSTNFPTMNPLQPANGGAVDAFVAKLNPSGSALVYSTYLGGSGDDLGQGIAVDSSGNAYVTGWTSSTNFPTMNPLQPTYGGGPYDVFVAAINPSGSALVYSTYLGGSFDDEGYGIAVDSSGNAYVTGVTTSTNFPTVTPLQPANEGTDAFVSEISPSGSALVYSTYLGGGGDFGYGIATDSSGNAYVTGETASKHFPTKNALQPTNRGQLDAFVTKINTHPAADVTLFPPNLDFGNQSVGIPSNPKISTLTNHGELPLTITSIQVTGSNRGDFTEKDDCGKPIPPTGSCKISVTFTPMAAGTRNAAVSITDNAPDSPQSVPLTGVGILPAVTFSPTSLTFPVQLVFTVSPTQSVTLTNPGPGVLLIRKFAVTGPFQQTNNCPRKVAAKGNCTIQVSFDPTTKGVLHGAVKVTDNAPGSPQEVPLTGTGTFVQLTPATVNFGTQPVGTRSLPKTVTLTNKGDGPVNITTISITGADSGDFAEKNNCGKQVPSGASCFIKVTFKPSAKGKRTADVSVSDDGGGSPQQVKLIGTGT
jgi:hypothetical protein